MQELRALLARYFQQERAEQLADVLMLAKDKQIPILINGKCGPTGKTTLFRELNRMGFDAAEPYEHYTKIKSDSNGASVTITLNRFVR